MLDAIGAIPYLILLAGLLALAVQAWRGRK